MSRTVITIQDRWGSQYFKQAEASTADPLPFQYADKCLLCDIGLPVGPKKALHFALRFENVDVSHRPDSLRLLTDCNLERSSHFPRTGHSGIGGRIDLNKCVVLGEAANDFSGRLHMSRYVCLDETTGWITWIYPMVLEGCTPYSWLNSSLTKYLQCLLAYKEYREKWQPLFEEFGGA
ncbi:MAG TPA: hypothetical protein VGZ25_14090, partial [Gemmataceae bacterium]|nr:hypothetical protein [Gemmataceae bacterium]